MTIVNTPYECGATDKSNNKTGYVQSGVTQTLIGVAVPLLKIPASNLGQAIIGYHD